MSDDLISRKALLKKLREIIDEPYNTMFLIGIGAAVSIVEHRETAFDKGKVIEELRELQKHSETCRSQCEFSSTEYFDYMGAEVAYKTAIEIVERGGIE